MDRLADTDLAAFQRRFRFAGGRLRRVRVRYAGDATAVEFTVSARTALRELGAEPKPVRLRFRLTGAEEFRFQTRPGRPGGKIGGALFGHLDGLFFVTLDAPDLLPGDRPAAHDFRASDAYAAGRELWWEVVAPKS
jgi:hypothetical protein